MNASASAKCNNKFSKLNRIIFAYVHKSKLIFVRNSHTFSHFAVHLMTFCVSQPHQLICTIIITHPHHHTTHTRAHCHHSAINTYTYTQNRYTQIAYFQPGHFFFLILRIFSPVFFFRSLLSSYLISMWTLRLSFCGVSSNRN